MLQLFSYSRQGYHIAVIDASIGPTYDSSTKQIDLAYKAFYDILTRSKSFFARKDAKINEAPRRRSSCLRQTISTLIGLTSYFFHTRIYRIWLCYLVRQSMLLTEPGQATAHSLVLPFKSEYRAKKGGGAFPYPKRRSRGTATLRWRKSSPWTTCG
jgi:hypothetical protein